MLHESLFVSDKIHERVLTLEDGNKHTLWFKQMPSGDLEKLGSAKDDARPAAISKAIAQSLCEPDGATCISAADAAKLTNGVRSAIVWEIYAINKMGATVGKALPPGEANGSGTSSSSTESAAGQ